MRARILYTISIGAMFIAWPAMSEEPKSLNAKTKSSGAEPSLQFRLVRDASSAETEEVPFQDGNDSLYLNKEALLDKKAVATAQAKSSGHDDFHITLKFNEKGSRTFAKISRKYQNKRLAIVLNGQILSAPIIQEEIAGGKLRLTGDFSEDQAKRIAEALSNESQQPQKVAPADITSGANDIEQQVRSLEIEASHLVNKDKYAKAIPLYKKATKLRPKCAEYHFALGMACVKIGDYKIARQHYLKALRILQEESKTDPERVDDLVMVLLCLNRDQEAKSVVNEAKNRFEDNETVSRLAEAYPELKQGFAEYQIQE